jgi:predicted transposase/invertase (TIGR01784 family)
VSITNPHDTFFKEIFSDKDRMVDLIRGALPDKLVGGLDLAHLVLDNASYVDEELKKSFSDLVYTSYYKSDVKIKISLLFEHKSTAPDYPQVQLLKYMTGIWDTQTKQKEALTPVVAIVLYHGKKKWKKKELIRYFKGTDDILSPYIPDMDYILIDLSSYSNEELRTKLFTEVSVEIALLIMKNIYNEENLRKHFREFMELGRMYFEEERGLRFLESVIRYMYSTTKIESQEVIDLVKKISETGAKVMMTTAMKLREEGRQEGRQEGRREALLDWIADILEIKFGTPGLRLMEQVKEIEDVKELESVKEKIKRTGSLEEIG